MKVTSIGAGLVLAALGLGLAVGQEEAVADWPAVKGAVFALRNANALEPVVGFDTKGRELLTFNLSPRGRGLVGRSYELVSDGGSFHGMDAGPWVGAQVAESGAFSVEVTMTPRETAPATAGVVVGFGDDEKEDFALLQDKAGVALRLAGGEPLAVMAVEAGKPAHVVLVGDKTKWTAYVDGKAVKTGDLAAGASAWGARQLVMGANWAKGEPWRGRMETIAVFARALSAEEVAAQAVAAKARQAARVPAKVLRFKGTLVAQAETSSLDAIKPYTRSLSEAEYKVDKVIEGEWDEPTITVLHWMILDSERLAIADRKVGVEVQLSVEPLVSHPQLESERRDEIGSALDLFYAEADGE